MYIAIASYMHLPNFFTTTTRLLNVSNAYIAIYSNNVSTMPYTTTSSIHNDKYSYITS